MIGQRLGRYIVLSSLGEGGMGSVYRARDTKLERDVAIKVLNARPDAAAGAARYRDEAQILASLNHPHIAAIYGFEESGDVHFLVLELVEGQTLQQRLKSGPIPTAEAMVVAQQIADAVGAAHERGVIHRDLKPANIAFTRDGQVKVLDFGVARVMSETGAGAFSSHAGDPTATTVAPGSRSTLDAGRAIVGTVAYMAPEQTKGRDADKRCDVWAFGCIVYEMLTGRRAFEGGTVAETIAAVLTSEPDWEALPADVPLPVRTLVRGCLEKDRRERVADIAAALFVLKHWRAASPPAVAAPGAARRSRWRGPAAVAATTLLTALVSGGLVWLALRDRPTRVTRTTFAPAGRASLTVTGNSRDLAITGDGTRIVYVGNNGTQLLVRTLDALDPVVLTGGSPRDVFISPDGQWVGFFRLSVLSKVPITGGPAVTVATADGPSRGAAWGDDGTIVFATPSAATGLHRVPADGGEPEILTRPDHQRGEGDHLWPAMLPGGRGVLFTIVPTGGDTASADVAVLDFRTGTSKTLVRGGSDARYVPSGHLVYVADGTLRAVAFDLGALEIRGTSVPVVPGVTITSTGAGAFAAADDGTLVYIAPGGAGTARTMAWIDRSGREEPLGVPPRDYVHPRISPDGTLVAVSVGGIEEDIWLWDFGRATLSRMTSERGTDHYPSWMPDGRRLVFSSARDGGSSTNLYWQSRDGISPVERLTTSPNIQQVTAVTPDGASLVFQEIVPTTGRDIMRLRLDAGRRVEPLLQTRFDERNGIVSPDGRWLAYESDSSGRLEVYVRPYPRVDSNQWQVSTAGGSKPLWAPAGSELFYLAADGTLMAAPIETGNEWRSRAPAALFTPSWAGDEVITGRTYDVSPDGRRFLFVRPAQADGATAFPAVVVVQGWFTELQRLVRGN